MSQQKALLKDPVGYKDWTLPVSIVGQVIEKLKVDIVAQTLANLKVDVAAQSLAELNVKLVASEVTLNVAITSSSVTLDVNIVSQAVTLNVAIQSSDVTLDVNVTNASLTVNIGAPLTDTGYVATSVVESVQIDVNIAASAVTLNVAIQSSAVTLDVNIASSAVTLNVAIKSSDVTLNVNVTNASITVNIGGPVDASGYVQTHIMDSVQLDVNIAASAVTLNVAIQSSAVTLDVNIASSAVTLDINVTNPVLQVGHAKPCLAFDGTDDKVEIPNVITSKPISLLFWVKLNSITASGLFESRNTTFASGGKGVAIEDSAASGKYGVGIGDGTNHVWAYDVINLSDLNWHFVAVVFTSSTGYAYVDGTLAASWDVSSVADSPLDASTIAEIAHGFAGYLDGLVSRVLIYSRDLSDTEIQQIYHNPEAPPTQGLVLWLNFDEGSGTTAHDRSGNGNDGTIYGATWVSEAGEVPALINVNLSAQTVTLEVKIVASDVTLNVAIQSSAVTLDVNITGSSVTLDVNVVGTANVNITDAIVNISALKLMDTGTEVINHGSAYNASETTLYTVPAGKKAYLYLARLSVIFEGTSGSSAGWFEVYDGTAVKNILRVDVSTEIPSASDTVAFTFLRLEEGWEVRVYAGTDVVAYATAVIVEVPA